jgi:hypothetical protein
MATDDSAQDCFQLSRPCKLLTFHALVTTILAFLSIYVLTQLSNARREIEDLSFGYDRVRAVQIELRRLQLESSNIDTRLNDARRQIDDIYVMIERMRHIAEENMDDTIKLVDAVQLDVNTVKYKADNFARDTQRRVERVKDELLALYPTIPVDLRDEQSRAAMGLYWGDFTQLRDKLYGAQLYNVASGYSWMKACERSRAPGGAPVKGTPNWCEEKMVSCKSFTPQRC